MHGNLGVDCLLCCAAIAAQMATVTAVRLGGKWRVGTSHICRVCALCVSYCPLSRKPLALNLGTPYTALVASYDFRRPIAVALAHALVRSVMHGY